MSGEIKEEFAYIDFENKRVGGVCKAKNIKTNIQSLHPANKDQSKLTPKLNSTGPMLAFSDILWSCGVDLV